MPNVHPCPVPGCGNNYFRQDQLFCSNCGLHSASRADVESIMSWWKGIQEQPEYVCKKAIAEGGGCVFEFNLLLAITTARPTWGQYVDMIQTDLGPDNQLDESGINRDAIVTLDDFLGKFYSSPKAFRIAHPFCVFFRCWHCDLYNDYDTGPLLPPEKFAHSTLADDMMRGRRPDYTRREKLKNMQILPPRHIDANVRYLQQMMPMGAKPSPEMMQQIQHLTQMANQRDQAEYDRQMQEHHRAVQNHKEEISRAPERPDARDHSPCPNCGAPFPFILRPLNDARYSNRNIYNYNKPLTEIELYLFGIDQPCDPSMDEAAWFQNLMDFYYTTCELPLNPIFVWRMENEKRKWKRD